MVTNLGGVGTGRTEFPRASTGNAKDCDTAVVTLEPQDVGWGLLRVPQMFEDGGGIYRPRNYELA